MYFWHFLANVSCRISRASDGFAPSTPTMALPWICLGAQNASPPDPQLQGGHCMLCLQQKIHTSCNLQTRDSGKNITILMRKLRENSGKMMLKIPYEPWRRGICYFCVQGHICHFFGSQTSPESHFLFNSLTPEDAYRPN